MTTAEQTLGLPGRTIHAAIQFGVTRDIDVKLGNKKTVRFVYGSINDGPSPTADIRPAGNQFLSKFGFTGSGSDDFDRILSSGAVEGRDASGVLTLRSLTPGKRYTVQLFSIDRRGRDGCGGDITDCRRRPVDFGDGEGHFSKRVFEGNGDYVLGSFVADRPTQTVVVRGWALNADGGEAWNLNAVVIYEP
ncbi:MAG: hypothetical protein ACHQPH_15285 [Reyranellales bacterium]|jgi:hypothetical protein